MMHNLLLNTCRESGDHGPVNSWDRIPYITTIGLNAPNASVTPAFRDLQRNFLIGMMHMSIMHTLTRQESTLALLLLPSLLSYPPLFSYPPLLLPSSLLGRHVQCTGEHRQR
jgi:hypothetical protein